MMTNRAQSNRTRGAFTLAEVIVSVAILAVVASALAAVFAAVGDTLDNGRRVSRLNTFAAQFVQVMQRDVEERMLTPQRAGNGAVLVIRHEFAAGRDPVQLAESDIAPRPRRIDQVFFFASGEFASGRRSLVPGIEIESDTAAVYYGHGAQQNPPTGTPDTVRTDPYFLPRLHDNNDDDADGGTEGVAFALGDDQEDHPNRYAADWVLARRASLFVSPSGRRTTDVVRQNLGFSVPASRLENSPVQFGLLPAAWSPFGALAGSDPDGPIADGFSSDPQGLYGELGSGLTPQVESGLVDIIYGSPSEVGQFLRSAHVRASQVYLRNRAQRAEWFYDQSNNRLECFDSTFSGNGYLPGLENHSREIMQTWMFDLMPGESVGTDWRDWSRPRVESVPTRVLPADDEIPQLAGALPDLATTDEAFVRDLLSTDQEMLGSGNYVPRCTEFIVEWSYGQVDRQAGPTFGQIVWYGLPRWDDRDGDGQRDANEAWIARPYSNDLNQMAGVYRPAYDERLPLTNLVMPGASSGTLSTDPARPWRRQNNTAAFYDFLGSNSETAYSTSLFAGGNDPQPWEGTTLPTGTERVQSRWVWPRLLRITISFADPEDPLVETTVQAVFRVPGGSVQ